MTTIVESDHPYPSATDGEIAAINLASARRRAWARFAQDPRLPGAAEAIVYNENLTAQFLGDLDALDRLEALASQSARVDDCFARCLFRPRLLQQCIALPMHEDHLARAALMGGPREEIERHSLTIDQACGVELDAVLAARRRIATASGRLEDLVPLGAVLADLRAVHRGGRCLSAGVLLVRRCFAVPVGVGLLSARYAVGRTRVHTGPESCRALVSTRNRLLAGLCESTRPPRGDLHEPGPN